MKRNKFISALSALTVAPSVLFSRNYFRLNRAGKGFKVENGKDRFDKSVTLFEGDTFYTKVSTKDTVGDLYIFESTRDKKGGPPLHYHYE
jgi:hypothetical protein